MDEPGLDNPFGLRGQETLPARDNEESPSATVQRQVAYDRGIRKKTWAGVHTQNKSSMGVVSNTNRSGEMFRASDAVFDKKQGGLLPHERTKSLTFRNSALASASATSAAVMAGREKVSDARVIDNSLRVLRKF